MKTEVCHCDVETGAIEVVARLEGRIEAPNWHPEGWLLVNGGGRLWRLEGGALAPLDTGFATACNNDHGISPDGRTMALTDKTAHGRAAIYLMEFGSAAPRQVVAGLPAWFHGFSPDGKHICYPAARQGRRFDLFLTDLASGAETCLCGAFEHIDGPDFSADGRFVWFNGTRQGRTHLWRIAATGGAPERMTADKTEDWFPHPSPDGAHVVWLAYPPGSNGHPADLEVELWLMPQAGGAARPLCRLFGGQGTLNSPPWLPDGRRFAYCRSLPGAN